jgi:FkbM family methyltransferase
MSRWRDRVKAIPILGPLLRRARRMVRPVTGVEWLDRRDDALMDSILDRILNPVSNVVDVGANVGSFLARVVRRAPHGSHQAFEPLPDHAADLRRQFPGITVHAAAVADRNGVIEFTQVVGNSAFSGLKKRTDLPPNQPVKLFQVPVVRLDDVFPADGRVDLIKIDVEGAEREVLNGAAMTLSRCRPWVLFEHGLGGVATYGTTSSEIHAALGKAGLAVWRMDLWLTGAPALAENEFEAAVASGHYWNFLAGPSDWLADQPNEKS